MKAGLITFHFVNNYGGLLQTYALYRTINEKLGIECEVIDYRNWFIRMTDAIRQFPISVHRKEINAGLVTMRERKERKRKFNLFIEQNIKLSKRYNSRKKLKNEPPKYDKYVCGSDQIWNPVITGGVDSAYFLDFVSDKKNTVSYAASFGTSGLPVKSKGAISKYLSRIEHISVREKEGSELVKEMTGKEAVQLIDPTFLIAKEEWEALAKNPKIDDEYILVYMMQRDDSVYEYARKLKERTGLKLVDISRYGYMPENIDTRVIDAGPREFLGLFKNARYVCTNSYHGFVYSIIFEKELCLVPCKRFTSRIENLMQLLNLESGKNIDENNMVKYDPAYIRKIIDRERDKSFTYLVDSLGYDKNKVVEKDIIKIIDRVNEQIFLSTLANQYTQNDYRG